MAFSTDNTSTSTLPYANMALANNFSSPTLSSAILIALAALTLAIYKLKKLLPLGNYQKPAPPSQQQQKQVGGEGALPVLPPGPKPLPLIGCLHWLVVNKPAFRWIHRMMEKMNTGIAYMRLGGVNVITVTSNEIALEFYHRQSNTFASRPVQMSTEIPTNGYLTVALTPSGKQWKKMRRVLSTEVLSVQRHRWLQDKRTEEADHLIRYVYNLCNQPDGGIVNLRNIARHYCGNMIRKLMFNRRFFGDGNGDGGPGPAEIALVDSFFKILANINVFSISDCLPWLRLFDLDGNEQIIRKSVETIKKYHDPVIDQRIHMWRNGIKKSEKDTTTEEVAQDLLDVLIHLTDDTTGAPLLTSSEIKAQILELMLAGVDNPSNSTEWTLAEMITQPKIQERAVKELDEVVGRERLVQESDLPKLNYVKACLKEAFRLHPVAAFNLPHTSIADTNVAGYFIPKGSHVFVSRLALGRNPKIWEEPLKYKPERHLNADGSEVVIADPKLGLLSFSTGRRGCPGVLLGSTMTTMLLARLLQGFTWTTPPNHNKLLSRSSSGLLRESHHDLFLSEPLLALAKPRLPKNVYPTP